MVRRWVGLLALSLLTVIASAQPAAVAPPAEHRAFLPLIQQPPRSSYWGVSLCCAAPDAMLAPRVAEQIQASGAGWTRYSLEWARVEPVPAPFPDYYDWSYHDQLFARIVQQNRMDLVVVINTAPRWATDSYSGQGPLKPRMLAPYLRFVQAAVERYSKPPYNVRYWEIYNEPDARPDVDHHLAGWGYDPLGYAELLKSVYPVIHAADPRAKVVLSPAYEWFLSESEPNGLFIRDWLDRVIDPQQGNAGGAFDVFGLHMYTFFRGVWEPHGRDVIGKWRHLQGLMASYGVSKPMIVTEMGQSSGSFGDPELQARYLIKGTMRSLAVGSELVIWFSLLDSDEWKRGLLDENLRPRPALVAATRMGIEMVDPVFREELGARVAVAPDVEGYFFGTAIGEVLVAWVDDEQNASTIRTVALPGSTVRTTDRHGAEGRVDDADDGQADGQVTLTLTREPLFVRTDGA